MRDMKTPKFKLPADDAILVEVFRQNSSKKRSVALPIARCERLELDAGSPGGRIVLHCSTPGVQILWSDEIADSLAIRRVEPRGKPDPLPAGLACYMWGANQSDLPSRHPQRLGWRHVGHRVAP